MSRREDRARAIPAPLGARQQRDISGLVDSDGCGMSPPGLLATGLAGRLVAPAGRDARPSRANVRHPAAAQVRTVQPFVLDGLPGTPPCRPRSVAGRGRAFGACCFAGKLRSPAGPALAALGRGGLTPTSFPTSTPTSFPTRWGGVPLLSCVAASAQVMPPRGASRPQKPRPTGPPRGSGASARQGALRAIDSFRRSRLADLRSAPPLAAIPA
jgi:hypothetical protein